MSLLNAALRKKEKENQRLNTPPPLFNKTGKIQPKTKFIIYGLIACLAIAIGLALPYLTDMLSPKRISPPLPQAPDLVTATQEHLTAGSLQPAGISSVQEAKNNEVQINLPGKPASQLPAQTKDTFKKAEKKPNTPSKPELSPKPTQKTPSALPSSSGFSPHQTTIKNELIKPFYEKAVQYHRQNRIKEAIMIYRQVLDKDPKNRDALFNLSCAYLENREFASALPILYDLYENERNNPLVMVNLAIAGIETGKPDLAISLLDDAQKIADAPLFDIYCHKAAALSRLGRLDEAKQSYEMAEKKDPGSTTLIFNMAILYDKMKNYKDALRYYRTFLEKNGWSSDKEKKSVEDRVLLLTAFTEKELNNIK